MWCALPASIRVLYPAPIVVFGMRARGGSPREPHRTTSPLTSGEGGGSHELCRTRSCSRTGIHPHRNGRGVGSVSGFEVGW